MSRLASVSTVAAMPWFRTLVVLWIAQVVSELAFSFALPFVPLYVQELGVRDVTQAGIWAGAMSGGFAIVMATMGPIWGLIADRHGRRLMIQRALFGACVIVGAMSLVQTPEQLLALRVLQGGVTGVVAATTTVVSLTVPRNHLAAALGAMHAAMFVGTSIGPVVGGAFSDQFGFRSAFAATGVLFLFSGVLVTIFVPEPPRGQTDAKADRESIGMAMRPILGRPELVAVIALMGLVRFANVAPNPVIPLFIQGMVDDQSRLATTAGLVVASTGLASTISALLTGRIADRYGRRKTLLGCLLLAVVLSVPHAFVTDVWQLLVLRMAMGLALGGMLPAIQALFSDLTPPSRRGMAFGILATASALGNGGGPVLGSLVAAWYGMPSVFVVIAPIFASGALLLRRVPGHHIVEGQEEGSGATRSPVVLNDRGGVESARRGE